MVRNIYVRAADEPTWERAQTLAAAQGLPLSVLVAEALEAHLAQLDTPALRREEAQRLRAQADALEKGS